MPSIQETIRADNGRHLTLFETRSDTLGDGETRRKLSDGSYHAVVFHSVAEEVMFTCAGIDPRE